MSKTQKKEVGHIFNGMRNYGNLDYVTAWYKKAALYIQGTGIEAAFVSTNSICQGGQVSILWPELMYKFGIKINFAHQTFKWSSEARGKAAVHCVIVGFSFFDRQEKELYLYETVTSQPVGKTVKGINAYLVDAPDVFIERRAEPLCAVPPMNMGSAPNGGGYFFLNSREREKFIQTESERADLIHPFLSSYEYLNKGIKFCIWLKDVPPERYRSSPFIMERITKVKRMREKSSREMTKKAALFPTLFAEIRQP